MPRKWERVDLRFKNDKPCRIVFNLSLVDRNVGADSLYSLGKVMPMQLTGAGNEPIRVANEGGESACDKLFAKIEQIALRNGCADSNQVRGID